MGPGEAILRGVPGGNGDAAPGRSKVTVNVSCYSRDAKEERKATRK